MTDAPSFGRGRFVVPRYGVSWLAMFSTRSAAQSIPA